MDLMQADPAFDVLFSLFGIGRFDSRGVLNVSLGGEVRHGPSYPDPV